MGPQQPQPNPQSLLKRALRWGTEGTLLLLVVFTPLAFGSVEPWAIAVIELGAMLAFACWLAHEIRFGNSRTERELGSWLMEPLRRVGVLVATGALALLVLVQLVPLPPQALRLLSPSTHKLYSMTLPGYADRTAVDFNRIEEWLLPGSEGGSAGEAIPGWRREARGDLAFPRWRPLSLVPDATLHQLGIFLAFLLLFIVAAERSRVRAFRRRLLWTAALTGVLVAMMGLAQATTWGEKVYGKILPAYGGSPLGPFVNKNHFAGYLELSIAVLAGFWLAHLSRERASRYPGEGLIRSAPQDQRYIPQLFMLSLGLGIGILALARSGSRGGLVAAGATAILFVFQALVRRGGQHGGRRAFLAVCLIVWVGGYTAWKVRALTVEGTLEPTIVAEPSFGQRLQVWSASAGMFVRFFGAGTGLGTYGYAIPLYQRGGYERFWIYAHNDYVQLACEMGIIGLILFAVGTLRFSRRALLPVLARPMERGGTALGCAAGVVSLLIHSLVDFNLQIPSNGMLFVLLAATLAGLAPQAIQEPGQPPGAARGGPLPQRTHGYRILVMTLAASGMLSAGWVITGALARRAQSQATSRFRSGQTYEAGDSMARALRIRPRLHDLQADSGFLYLRAAQAQAGAGTGLGISRLEALQLARDAFCRAINLNPGNTNPWSGLGEVYLEASTEQLRSRELDLSVLIDEGTTLSALERLYVAVLRKMMALEPRNPYLHARRGDFFWERGSRETALNSYTEAARLLPRVEELTFLGSESVPPEILEAAVRGMEKALKEDSSGLPAHLIHSSLSVLQARKGDTDQAIEHIERAGELLPANLSYRIRLGYLLFKAGELDRSRRILLESIEAGVRDEYVYTYLAMISAKKGERENTIDYYRRAQAVNPENGRTALALARQYEESGEPRKAEAQYEKCLELLPDDVSALLAAGEFQARRGIPSRAVPIFSKIVALRPNDDVYRERLEQIKAAAGLGR